MTCQTYHFG